MQEEGPKVANVESPTRLECTGIWGGIRNRDLEITAGKVIGSIYSAVCCEGGKGGDIYTRLAIADVVGHGEVVSEVSQYVYDSLKGHM
jgi:hypothetical protein